MRLLLLVALSLVGCRGESTTYITEGAPSCVRSICEVTMSTTLTGVPADADFSTGLVRPDSGEDPSVWSLVLDNDLQKAEDRFQALQRLGGLNSGVTRLVAVPLWPSLQNSSTRFTSGVAGGVYWEQTSVASAGFLQFVVPPLPVGAVITQVIARWGNNFNTTLPIGTPPAVALTKSRIAVGTTFLSGIGDPVTIGTQADTTAVVATYKALHDITLSVNETVSADAVYSVNFTGEDGANESTGGVLAGILLTIGLP
jgi:hypothetical protein